MLNKRSIDIIRYLIDNNLEISLKETASTFEISERSIRYDIENINYHLLKSGYKEIEKVQRGIYATEENIENIKDFLESVLCRFYTFSSDERKDYLKVRFLFHENNRLFEIGDELDVSLSTIKTDLKEVKSLFNSNSLELNFISKQGVILEGKEENIRQMQLKYAVKYIEISKNIFASKFLENGTLGLNVIGKSIMEVLDDCNIQIIKFFIKRIEKKLDVIISDEAFNTLIFYLIISFQRIKNKKIIENRKQNREFLIKTKEFSVISQEIGHLENEFQITFNESEVLILTELFLGSHSYNFNSSFLENWIELETTVVHIIKSMSQELNMNLRDQMLVDGLLNHLKPAYYRVKNNISLDNTIAEEVEKTYTDLFLSVEAVSKPILERYLGKNLPREEIAYITMHFKTAIDRFQSKNRQTKNLLLVCSLGYGSSKILAQKLTELYDINIVDVLPYHKFLEYKNFKDIDLIISTINLEYQMEIKIPVIKVNTILSKENKETLLSFGLSEQKRKISLKAILESIKETCSIDDERKLIMSLKKNLRNLYINDIENNSVPSLKLLLNSKTINYFSSISTWEEAIHLTGDVLVKEKATDKEYIDHMIENINKNGSYMVMGNNLALPHAKISNSVHKTGMSLGIFDTPIEFPNKKFAKIILCFSSKDKKEHMEALNEFLQLIEDQNILTISKDEILTVINK